MHKLNQIYNMFNSKKIILFISLFIIVFSGFLVHTILPIQVEEKEDIYYLWIEGKRLLSGENPYARVLLGNMRENDKYATYFPLFYLMSYLTQLFGLKNYPDWLNFWSHAFFVFNLGISLSLFVTLFQYDLILLGFFSALFWLFNRWTLHVTTIAHIDFIPIFFLILSLLIFYKNKRVSLFLFSLSLAIKQIAIFLAPLYLIWTWRAENRNKSKKILIAFAIIISIPLLTSIPFILWNSEGFFKSIFFSATRNPGSHFNAPSLDVYIGNNTPNFVGIKAKIPMLLLMTLLYISTLRHQLGMYTSSLLTMSVFIDFNSVLFLQYMCWVVPFIPLCVCDQMQIKRELLTGNGQQGNPTL